MAGCSYELEKLRCLVSSIFVVRIGRFLSNGPPTSSCFIVVCLLAYFCLFVCLFVQQELLLPPPTMPNVESFSRFFPEQALKSVSQSVSLLFSLPCSAAASVAAAADFIKLLCFHK